MHASLLEYFFGALLLLSSLGVILFRKPIYSSLSFLFSLLTIAGFYFMLHAEFIGVMQILVYAGAILVIFVFVIILFQDVYTKIEQFKAKSNRSLLAIAGGLFAASIFFLGWKIQTIPQNASIPKAFGSAEAIGQALYLDFFFPFEAVTLLFLAAVVGAFYIAKKEV